MRRSGRLLARAFNPETEGERRRALLDLCLISVAILDIVVTALLYASDVPNLPPFRETLWLAIPALGVVLLTALCWWLNHHVSTLVAAILFVAMFLGAILVSDSTQELVEGRSVIVFAVPLVLASALIRPFAGFLVAGAVGGYIVLASLLILGHWPNLITLTIFMILAIVSWLVAHSLESALANVRRQVAARAFAERELRSALQFSDAVIASAGEGILACDGEQRIVIWNDFMANLTGLPGDTVLGRRLPEVLELGETNETERLIHEVLSGRAVTERVAPFRVPARGKGGWLEMDLTPRRSPDGEVSGVIGLARDITAQRRLEQEFRQAQKMEAVGRLAGGVAHDFNNMLTVIGGYTEYLASGETSESQRAPLHEIREAVRRAGALTAQLLAFSRRQVLEVAAVDLNDTLRGMESMIRRLIGEDVRLALELEGGLGSAMADPARLEQVIMNLVVNARDAMPEGGDLLVRTRNVTVDTNVAGYPPEASSGPHVLLEVIDTGTGMDEETQAHLFEPFFTTKERGKGTGLGLSTTYGIVRQCGGFIAATSVMGSGSRFAVHLPCVDEAAQSGPAHPPPVPTSTAPTANGTVLLVEDDEAVRALVGTMLRQGGWTVISATSGVEALGAAAGHAGRIDLLLTDVIMPSMSGRELAQRVARDRPGISVLFMSGYTADVIAPHGVLEPGIHLLRKPFTRDELQTALREAMGPPSPGG